LQPSKDSLCCGIGIQYDGLTTPACWKQITTNNWLGETTFEVSQSLAEALFEWLVQNGAGACLEDIDDFQRMLIVCVFEMSVENSAMQRFVYRLHGDRRDETRRVIVKKPGEWLEVARARP
jgi:hypothetical protein